MSNDTGNLSDSLIQIKLSVVKGNQIYQIKL